ncbi:MAG: hypothetical protein BGO77_08560 [Caedibacter sp. 37-49]|nr:MAG: hypothetical protein BGO77_08560 [Caedibacter sp. 37-49]
MFLPFGCKIYLASTAVDLRKSYQTLGIVVKNILAHDPLCGHLFVFYNKRRDTLKILYWDTNGFCLWSKKLEKGKFILPFSFKEPSLEMSVYHLQGLIQGIDCWQIPKAKRLSYCVIS